MITTQPTKLPSEGEEFLADFFTSVGIKFEAEKRIDGLSDDSKTFRAADFYLPKFKVYVEFFGLWNNSDNVKYRQKKDVYWKNKIPCIYIYPENLGIIHYIFDKRIQIVLEQHGMKRELRKYRFYKLNNSPELGRRVLYSMISLYSLYLTVFPFNLATLDWVVAFILSAIALYQFYCIYDLCVDIFKRNKYSLDI